jgi:hypothetical protein
MRDNRPRLWLRSLAALIAVGAVATLTAVSSATATPDRPRYECPPRIADCTTVTGDWLDVPGGGSLLGRADDQLVCPSGEPVGFTYDGQIDARTRVYIQVFQNYPFTRNPWNPGAGADRAWFEVLNSSLTPTTVRAVIGCAPASALAPTPALTPVRVVERERIWTERLAPSETKTYTHACSRGRRLLYPDATVEFLTQRRPSMTDLTAVKLSDHQHGNRETVRVTTTGRLRPSARAVLKIYLFCQA